MKRASIFRVIVAVVFAMFVSVSVNAQESDMALYNKYLTNAWNDFNQKKYDSAINWFKQVSEIIKRNIGENNEEYISTMLSITNCHFCQRQYKEAILYSQEALKLIGVPNTKNIKSYSFASSLKARSLYELGESIESISELKTLLNYQKEYIGKYSAEYATTLNNLAANYAEIGYYRYSIELNSQALEVRGVVSGKNNLNYANSLNNLAVSYANVGDYATAAELYEETRKVILSSSGENGTRNPYYAIVLNNIANSYATLGKYNKAVEICKQAIDIRKSTVGEMHIDYASSLSMLAAIYSDMGDYSQAIILNKQALTICKNNNRINHPKYASILNNLAGNYSNIGDLSAIGLYIQALEIYSQKPNSVRYAKALSNLANYYCKIKDYPKAIELAEEVATILKKLQLENSISYISVLNNIASYYSRSGNNLKAIELYTQVLKIIENKFGEEHPRYSLSLNNLAYNYSKAGDYPTAINLYKQAMAIRKKTLGENHPDYALSLSNIGTTYYRNGEYDKLTPIWQEQLCVDKNYIFKQFRSLLDSQRQLLWQKFSNRIIVANNQYAPLSEKYPEATKTSYNSLLFTKGLILSASIEFDKVIKESGNEELLKVFEELRTTRAILNTYYNKPIAERPESEVKRLKERAAELEDILINGSKEYRDFTEYLDVEWQNVRDALGDKDVAVEFLAAENLLDEKTEPYYAALVLHKGWDAPKYVELMKAEELKEYYLQGSRIYSGIEPVRLYKKIWTMLEPYINEGDNVFFSPDGMLHQMNIEQLYKIGDNRTLIRACERYNLYRVSSTREVYLKRDAIAKTSATLYGGLQYSMSNDSLLVESKKHHGEARVVTFRADRAATVSGWNELPNTKVEIERIDKMCKEKNLTTKVYIANAGNEESFKALSGKKTPIIHLATHGFFYKNEEVDKRNFFRHMMISEQQGPSKPDNSLKRSGLIFAGAQRAWTGEEIPENVDDGILLAEEIATMDLSGTDLVVMSACQTGLGEITSEGVFGLQRAFKKAGVKTLIMSLWKVDDNATALFMECFYERWLGGASKHKAFAAAQKTVREHTYIGDDGKTYNYSNPHYWAAFIMLDDYQKE